jgi:UDP-GlcNAc:undecaprenyl-phosphate GlcNAc-1-phosphate transferase
MITGFTELFTTILVSASIALFTSPVFIWLSRRIGFLDKPGTAEHKQHASATPLAGGVIFILSAGMGVTTFGEDLPVAYKGILIGVVSIAAVGIVDDRFTLKPAYKFLGQVLAATIVILFDVQVHITQIIWLDILISYLWLVGLANAFNFVDSMDSLAVGLAGIAAAFFMLVAIDAAQPELALLSASILGSMIGLFLYCAPPARLFLGDSGAQALGLSLAAIGLAYVPGQAGLPQALTWFTPVLVLGVPLFDMVLVIISRLRRRLPIYQAGLDHIYHRLVRYGMHSTRAVALMQITAILLSLLAFILLGTTVTVANVLFVCICFIGGLALFGLERVL